MPPRRSRASNSTRPASAPPALNITAGSIFFLPRRDQLGSDVSGNDSDFDEGKYGHMVLVLENNERRKRKVQVLGVRSLLAISILTLNSKLTHTASTLTS